MGQRPGGWPRIWSLFLLCAGISAGWLLRDATTAPRFHDPLWWALLIAGLCSLLLFALGLLIAHKRRISSAAGDAAAPRNESREEILRVQKAVESSSDAICITDIQGIPIYQNAAFAEMFGYSLEEMRQLSSSVHMVTDSSTAEKIRGAFRPGISWHGEAAMRAKNGRLLVVILRLDPILDDAARLIGFVGVHTEITARKNWERQLAKAHEAALEASRLKSQFLANVSHEVRTPMNGVLGMTKLLLTTELTKDQRESVELIERSGDALLRIINDILDFSRMEAGKMDLDSEPFQLRAVLDEVSMFLGPSARAKGVGLSVQIAANVPPRLRGDMPRIRQVVMNLVGNAVKFTHLGLIIVDARQVSESKERVRIRLEVRDTGIGIPPEAHSRIFLPFFQADGSTRRQYGGTGLGLSICKQLVEKMGGEIGVISTPERGSTFWVELPLTRAADEVQRLRQQPSPLSGSVPEGHRGHVLIAEDNLVNQRVALRMVERLGFTAEIAASGHEALACLQERSFSLILMDCQMPGMDGFETAAQIRIRESNGVRLPIVAMTAGAMPGDREKCLSAGMDDYIAKPIDPAELETILERWSTRHMAAGAD